MQRSLFMTAYRIAGFLVIATIALAPAVVSQIALTAVAAGIIVELVYAAIGALKLRYHGLAALGTVAAIAASDVGLIRPLPAAAIAAAAVAASLALRREREHDHRALAMIPPAAGMIVLAILAADPAHWPDRTGLLLMMMAIGTQDMCAMYAGRILCGPRLAPNVSPNKTVSGSIAGLIGGTAFMIVATGLTGTSHPPYAVVPLLVCAQLSDLYFSNLKRALAVKDFSNLLGGKGGILDRADSLIFPLLVDFILHL